MKSFLVLAVLALILYTASAGTPFQNCMAACGNSYRCRQMCSYNEDRRGCKQICSKAFGECFTVCDADDDVSGNALSASSIWSAYQKEVVTFLTAGRGSKSLQILTKPMEVTYDLEGKSGELDALLNAVAAPGPVRKVKEGSVLPTDFFEFINNLKLKKLSPQEQAKIDQKAEAVEVAQKALDAAKPMCETQFARFSKLMPDLTFDAFAAKYCFALKRAKENLMTAEAIHEMELRRAAGATHDVVQSLDDFAKFSRKAEYPWYETSSNLAIFRKQIAAGRTSSFNLRISKSELNEGKTNSEWQESGTEEPLVQSESTKKFTFTTSSDIFKMNIQSQAYKAISVEPREWFSQEVLINHATGPFKDKKLAAEFFGANGKLSMIPKKLYLVYKPTVSLQVGSSDAQYFKTVKRVKVGPFEGQPSVQQTDEIEYVDSQGSTTTEKVYSVTIQSDSPHPLLVAVDYTLN